MNFSGWWMSVQSHFFKEQENKSPTKKQWEQQWQILMTTHKVAEITFWNSRTNYQTVTHQHRIELRHKHWGLNWVRQWNVQKKEKNEKKYLLLGGHALPLLSRLLHSFAQGLCILHHCFELGVSQNPQQIIQDKNQLWSHHVAVLYLYQVQTQLFSLSSVFRCKCLI